MLSSTNCLCGSVGLFWHISPLWSLCTGTMLAAVTAAEGSASSAFPMGAGDAKGSGARPGSAALWNPAQKRCLSWTQATLLAMGLCPYTVLFTSALLCMLSVLMAARVSWLLPRDGHSPTHRCLSSITLMSHPLGATFDFWGIFVPGAVKKYGTSI